MHHAGSQIHIFFSLSPLCFAATHFFLVPSLEAADHLQVAATIAKASFTTQKIHIILAARTSLPKLMLIAAAQAKFLSPAYILEHDNKGTHNQRGKIMRLFLEMRPALVYAFHFCVASD
jgi:hypothetical protein